MGGYGFLRLVLPFFPDVWHGKYNGMFMLICVIGIIYGSMMAFAQRDIKKLVAYSSVAHMGTCMLGVFSLQATGVEGGVYQMLNHGISTGALFLLIGMLYERTHSRDIPYFGGIAKVIPLYTVAFVIVTLSSIGLPLTNGFIGEFACLLGAFLYKPVIGVFASTGVILGAVYMLFAVKRVFFGKVTRESNLSLPDLNGREAAVLLPLIVTIFVMGVMPAPFFKKMDPAVEQFLKYTGDTHLQAPAPAKAAAQPKLEK
jgi:NADH-quinone oxidoreductase subunit M